MTRVRRAILSSCLLAAALHGGTAAGSAQAATPQQLASFFRAVQVDNVSAVKEMAGKLVNPNEINPVVVEISSKSPVASSPISRLSDTYCAITKTPYIRDVAPGLV